MELGERKLKILQAIIDDYIMTAVPVGSRTISKKYSMGLSSATIRNEMSDLEDLGYLDQPHTSAGRVPSDKAYRLYVDKLMRVTQLSPIESERVKRYFDSRIDEIEQVIHQTAKALSNVTNYTSLVLTPQLNKVMIKHVQLVPLQPGTALVVVVTDSGIIKDVVIRVPEEIDADYLFQISKMLSERFNGHFVDEIDMYLLEDIEREIHLHREFFHSVIGALNRSLKVPDDSDVVLGGASNILNYPEYNDIEKARSFLAVLEEKELLYQMLTRATNCEVSISIGSENEYEEIKDCSIVTATYRIGNRTLGSIGVIGPTRMKYASVVSVLDFMRKSLSEILTNISGHDT